jgi:hypothetical protein
MKQIAICEAALMDPDLPAAWRSEATDGLDIFLRSLAYGPVSRAIHNAPSLSLQRGQLNTYLLREKFPTNNGERGCSWIAHHWQPMIRFLVDTPCFCTYETSHEAFLVKVKDGKPRTIATATNLILSTLHGSIDPASVSNLAFLGDKSPS